MWDVRDEQVHRVIRIDDTECVLAETNRQPGAHEPARLPWLSRRGPPPPDMARSLAKGDEHAHRRHGVEHRPRVPLRLVERELFFLRTRLHRETRRVGRHPVFVLPAKVVERRPDEHLQLRKVLLYDAQYTLVLSCGLWIVKRRDNTSKGKKVPVSPPGGRRRAWTRT